MQSPLLFVNFPNTDDFPNKSKIKEDLVKKFDKETLVDIVIALMSSNDAYRKYIDVKEKEYE